MNLEVGCARAGCGVLICRRLWLRYKLSGPDDWTTGPLGPNKTQLWKKLP